MNHSTIEHLSEKAGFVFEDVVSGAISDLIEEYNGREGYAVKAVQDSPLITGIDRYMSVMVKHPSGVEMIVCIYWVSGSERLVAENIRMVTLSKTFGLFTVTREELYQQIKFLSGIARRERS